MATVILVRHGRSTANVQGILAGRSPGVELDEHGRMQARALADALRHVARAYTSPMDRCRQTAEGAGLVAEVVPGLDECDYGQWTGERLDALASLELWDEVQRHPSGVHFPQGESLLEMRDRAVAAVAGIVQRHRGESVAVFSHGDPIKAILADALAMPFDEFQRLDVAPGSISVVDYSGVKPLVRLIGAPPGPALPTGPARPLPGGSRGA